LGKITSLHKLGDVAAWRSAACVLCALHTTHMPSYGAPEHGSYHDMCRRMQAYYAAQLLYSGTR